MKAFPKRVSLAATSALAVSLAVAGGQLADGAMHAADAARKHLAGVKYEDIPSTKKTKATTSAAPQTSIGIRKR